MPELEKIVWPGNPAGGMIPYGMGMPGMLCHGDDAGSIPVQVIL